MDFNEVEGAVGFLVRDEPEGEFGRGGGGEDGLGAFALVAAGQPVDFGRGADADAFHAAETFLAGEEEDAGFALVVGFADGQGGKGLAFGRVEFGHIVIKTRNGDAALGIVQSGQHPDQRGGGVHDRAAEDPRVEVGGGPAHDDFHRGDAAQALGQRGVALRDHSRVRDGDDITAQLGAAGADKVIEIRAADFLLAFDEEDEIDRQGSFFAEEVNRTEDVGEDLSFVVRRPAGEDTLVADGRFERRGGPEIHRFLGLDIIVSVNEHGRLARRLGSAGQHGGVSAGFRDLGLESAVPEQGGEPIRAGPHFGGVVRFGRDTAEAEEVEEQIQIGFA